jgi:RimJ/RimL family protein N-acetyltransferase
MRPMHRPAVSVGTIRIRREPRLLAEPPEGLPYRGRGCGKTLLTLVLVEARRIGLERVRLTVTDDNPTSRHIVEKAGGVLAGEFTARTGELYRLFEITLDC